MPAPLGRRAARPGHVDFLELVGPMSDIRAVPLKEPVVEHSVDLVAVDRDPVSPLVLALFECAKSIDAPAPFKRK
jgi:hypothetical protein